MVFGTIGVETLGKIIKVGVSKGDTRGQQGPGTFGWVMYSSKPGEEDEDDMIKKKKKPQRTGPRPTFYISLKEPPLTAIGRWGTTADTHNA